jgi:hypothetical protein
MYVKVSSEKWGDVKKQGRKEVKQIATRKHLELGCQSKIEVEGESAEASDVEGEPGFVVPDKGHNAGVFNNFLRSFFPFL